MQLWQSNLLWKKHKVEVAYINLYELKVLLLIYFFNHSQLIQFIQNAYKYLIHFNMVYRLP